MKLCSEMFKINRSEIALVDFQNCHGNDTSIYIKELVFMGWESITPNYFLFRPPFDKRELTRQGRKKNAYCKKFVNGLEWGDGNVNYNDVGDVLSPLHSYKYIFVFGKAKKDFLTKYINSTIINLENNACLKNLTNYFTSCPIHKDIRFKCALNNIFKIFIFLEKNYNHIEDFVFNEINN